MRVFVTEVRAERRGRAQGDCGAGFRPCTGQAAGRDVRDGNNQRRTRACAHGKRSAGELGVDTAAA